MTPAGRPGRIAVLGAGAWGTALASALAARTEVVLWGRDAERLAVIARERRNERYLPGQDLHAALGFSAVLAEAVAGASLVIAATPVAGLRGLMRELAALRQDGPLVWLCKGFERPSGCLPHQVVAQTIGAQAPCGALSGPSFAAEVARGLPCALTLASCDAAFAREAALRLHGGALRVYYTTDLVGVEVGGAVKNVMAIAVGLCDGLALGQNARAALITRGLAEIARLGIAMGGQTETFMGLAGAGDLILTATGDLSRNRRVGLELARGQTLRDILAGLGHVAEGVPTAHETLRLARAAGVEMPLTAAVVDVLEARTSPRDAVLRLLSRDPKPEQSSGG